MSKVRVPMSSPDIGQAERRAVAEVLATPVLSMGNQTETFERAICEYTGSAHAVAVSSGTAGLHLCVRAAGIQAGDLVLTTPFSFIASSNVLLYENAIPIFIDVDLQTGNIDVSQLEQAAHQLSKDGKGKKAWLPRRAAGAKRLKALLAVDVFGQPANYDAIMNIAKEQNLVLIEDSCEALGAQYNGHIVGRFGQSGVYAFYPNKQMTTGEGGAIVTEDGAKAELMRALRNQGRASSDTWLQHTYLGYNYRITEMSAALGRAQLARLDELLAKREQVAAWYRTRLKDVEFLKLPHILPSTTRMSWFVFVIRLTSQVDRGRLASLLEEVGIPTRPYFAPIHLQPYMIERFGYRAGDFPVTEELGRCSIALPFSSVMSEDQVDLVCSELKRALPKSLN